ncbi:MAG TPA: tetratricopeptide repeat protein, partial [bacterium]|nr:tetratricopeptide repeat protein [bacterium]
HHGVWVAELAALSDAAAVPHAIAATLDVSEQPGIPMLATLATALRSRALLLLLDNCEHLRNACGGAADALLRECPGLKILVTSREPLGNPGETIWAIPSLSFPDPRHLPPLALLAQYEAVRLFAERAASSRPGFRVVEANARAVAEICQRLDGIPLAIELAAARVRALTAEEIAARLDDRFRLLATSAAMILPRHRTLRAAMDWSFALLSEKERMLFRRYAVFAGGWTLEAAEDICSGRGLVRHEVVDVQSRLVDKSLVVAGTRGQDGRYRLLETVRHYSRKRLEESGEAEYIRTRHRDWCLALAERAEPELRGPEQRVWLERLECEHDNLQAALESSWGARGGAGPGLRLAGALCWFWFMRGSIGEGRRWLEKSLSANRRAASIRAKALCGAGILAWRQDEYDRARSQLRQSFALSRRRGDKRAMGFAYHWLAHIAETEADWRKARSLFHKSLALCRRVRDAWGRASTLNCLGMLESGEGNYDRAAGLLEESLALFREVGDRWSLYSPMSGLGILCAMRGEDSRATALLEESLAMTRQMGHKTGIAIALVRLGQVVLRRGDHLRAAALYQESLALRRELGDKVGIALCLMALAGVAMARGQQPRAARLFGAAEALREAVHACLPAAYRGDYERHLLELQRGLDETALTEAWVKGRTMTVDESVQYVLESEKGSCGTTGPPLPPVADAERRMLTGRQLEIAELIAHGLSNRAIAARLVIGERTAEGHVQNILDKLGFSSRAQIAAWAVRQHVAAGLQG